MRERVLVAGREVGPGRPCFVIAEAGVNHNGERAAALALVDAAAAAGVDAVKFQTFSADALVTRDAPKAAYQRAATDAAESQHAMLVALELGADDYRALLQRCAERGVIFLSSAFDEASAELLAELGVAAFKTGSGELTNLALIERIARLGRPAIVSTGMATLAEVEAAVDAFAAAGGEELALLHCVSNYPAQPASVNLRAMGTLRCAFGLPTGYSDHTLGREIALAAVALGACILEKHLTLDRTLPGPDHRASLEPLEFAALVRELRAVEAALGDGRKRPAAEEADTAAVARKSLAAACDLAAGDVIGERHVAALRPGTGLAPALRTHVVGRRARYAIPAGTLFAWEMLD